MFGRSGAYIMRTNSRAEAEQSTDGEPKSLFKPRQVIEQLGATFQQARWGFAEHFEWFLHALVVVIALTNNRVVELLATPFDVR